jgi:hypothetical protein
MLTVKQHELLSFIHDRLAAKVGSPRYCELGGARVQASDSVVRRRI